MALTGPYYWNGTTFPMQGGSPVLITEAEFLDCCCIPCSCSCDQTEWQALIDSATPCGGLVQCYQIKNYNDGDIPASTCGACSDNGALPIWAGKFTRPNDWPACSQWDLGKSADPSFYWRMDGKALGWTESHLRLIKTPPCHWEISLRCPPTPGFPFIWVGTKATGSTPVGIYTRASGCAATPSSLAVEECP